jgi:uridine phosphorylase
MGASNSEYLPISKVPRHGLPEYALVAGDVRRVKRIAALLEDSALVSSNREYDCYRGRWKGSEIVVASHGVGAPGAMCLFQEMAEAGVQTIIRVGTCGGIQDEIEDGDLIIATGVVRDDGVTDKMIPATYPAVSSPEVTMALQVSAVERELPWHRGITWTKSLFYPGMIPLNWQQYIDAGILAVEMELSALLVMASMRGLRAGGILTVDGNPTRRDDQTSYNPDRAVVEDAVGDMIQVGLDALHLLEIQSLGDQERQPPAKFSERSFLRR